LPGILGASFLVPEIKNQRVLKRGWGHLEGDVMLLQKK